MTLCAREQEGAWLCLTLPTPADADAYTALGISRALWLPGTAGAV